MCTVWTKCKDVPKLWDGRVYVYIHRSADFIYYGISNDPIGRWNWGKGYLKQEFGRVMMEAAREEGKSLAQYWAEDMEHEIVGVERNRKMAELVESLLVVRNKGKLNVVNGNMGGGVKYVEGWQEMTREELVEKLMKEYEKEKNDWFDFE